MARGRRQKTHGRWIGPDGGVRTIVSGEDERTPQINDTLRSMGCPRVPIATAADVEMKLVALMREKGADDPEWRHFTLVINNRPCRGILGCATLIGIMLPEGYSLTIHAPNYHKRIPGGAKPWWR
ncbi:hypothetical protein NLX83_38185 [Allokutzneria sp. A3M-2-11 16]|uniref:DddA-like double-stranded DNA deaminase toxin n=1 Tax=Allokutzneria sp. A3M-2-11 16 TaxID=2962043 RepID=UPI0020B8910F|nr:DddA-like double-stranded DNA deaminase toxin [Allokutzneria sp. A3M-2-11 16]MCP3805111.1 hypothetical protein [Allokutzneria sp. A3M-2-11 16]